MQHRRQKSHTRVAPWVQRFQPQRRRYVESYRFLRERSLPRASARTLLGTHLPTPNKRRRKDNIQHHEYEP
jgi:hypothetical protein